MIHTQRSAFRLVLLPLYGLLATTPTFGAEPLRFAQPIVLPAPLEREELVAIELGREVFVATRDGLPDLRVLDAQGTELAFVLRPATVTQDRVDRRYWSIPKPTVKLIDDGGVEIAFELDSDDPIPLGLRLISPLADFERRVQVFSSADGDSWAPRVADGLVFDYSRIIDARDDKLALSPIPDAVNHRRFRIVVGEVTQAQQTQLLELTRKIRGGIEAERLEKTQIRQTPYRIDRIELWHDAVSPSGRWPRLVNYAVKFDSAAVVQKEGLTEVTIETGRQPITFLQLNFEDRYFSRSVRVEIEVDLAKEQTQWTTLASSTLSRLDFRNLQREQLAIELAETRVDRMRLVIENLDSPPLKLVSIAARGPAYEVFALAPPAAELRLAYGSPVAESPKLDASAVEALLAENVTAVLGKLADQEVLAEVVGPQESNPMRFLESSLFLTTAVGLLAAVLAVGLYRASKRIDQLPSD